ncbi:hypothetical protein IJ707_06285, partial [bacterium]|nr:hypothetical protein [bacterium]
YMKRIFIIFVILLFGINFSFANEISAETNALSNKEIRAQLNKIKTKRIIIANALLLNTAQKKKANEIYSKIIEKEAIQLAQLRKEQAALKVMTKENTTSEERKAQRRIVYSLQEAVRTSENQADKEFKKILTREQRVKFKRLKKEITISDF